jgi:hypothetical protein
MVLPYIDFISRIFILFHTNHKELRGGEFPQNNDKRQRRGFLGSSINQDFGLRISRMDGWASL